MDEQTGALLPHGRKHGTVDSLGAEHVDVENPCELLGCEVFEIAGRTNTRVVDENVDAPALMIAASTAASIEAASVSSSPTTSNGEPSCSAQR